MSALIPRYSFSEREKPRLVLPVGVAEVSEFDITELLASREELADEYATSIVGAESDVSLTLAMTVLEEDGEESGDEDGEGGGPGPPVFRPFGVHR